MDLIKERRRWKIKQKLTDSRRILGAECLFREKPNGTLGHVLCYCEHMLKEKSFNRPKWRHSQVLSTIVFELSQRLTDCSVLCNLPESKYYYTSLPLVSSNQRPGLLLFEQNELFTCELPCPIRAYLPSRNATKHSKYEHLVKLFEQQNFCSR
ncbi:hypothetical protein RCL1_008969 [Eukaryota sp. TZLM3-RCL]